MDGNGVININTILCQEYDSKEMNVNKIFNEITANSSNRATFTLLIFINVIGNIEKEAFTLHHYLFKKRNESAGKKQGIYLGAGDFIRNSKNEDEDNNSENIIASFELRDIPFISEGNYVIETYLCDGRLKAETFQELKEKSAIYRNEGKMVSFADFKVKFSVVK